MNPIVKTVLWVLLGMVLMFVILKLLSSRVVSDSNKTWNQVVNILSTQQFYNLTKTNEFKELVKLPEVSDMLQTLVEDQVTVISQSLFNKTY